MKIILDSFKYHAALINRCDYPFIKELCEKYNKYDDILISKISIATVKENLEVLPSVSDKDIVSFLSKKINKKLSIILKNEKYLSTDHYSLYENNVAISLNKIIDAMNTINKKIDIINEESFDFYYILLLNNILRSMRGIISLISIGDDVHGMALSRGMIEQIAKADFIEKFDVKEDFVKYSDYNGMLQYAKGNNDYSKIPNELKQLFVENNISIKSAKAEEFLLYRWMKNDEVVIHNGTELIKYEFKGNNDILILYHIASEFVHEDYISTNYDYIIIRDFLLHFIFDSFDTIIESITYILSKYK